MLGGAWLAETGEVGSAGLAKDEVALRRECVCPHSAFRNKHIHLSPIQHPQTSHPLGGGSQASPSFCLSLATSGEESKQVQSGNRPRMNDFAAELKKLQLSGAG